MNGQPSLAFIGLAITSAWGNRACIEAMLRSSGLRIVERPCNEFCICQPDAALPSNMRRWNEEEYWAAVGQASGGG